MQTEIEVLQPGLFSTIQDTGRTGFLKYGVPVSGVMDTYAAKVGNLMLRNPVDAAVLEMTQMGPKLQFSGPAKVVVSGGDLSAKINGVSVPCHTIELVKSGDILSFGRRSSGCRAYLAVQGGFKTEEALGSRSWYEGITASYKIEKGEKLSLNASEDEKAAVNANLKVDVDYLFGKGVRAFEGPEFGLLTKSQQDILQTSFFSIGRNNNRMAIQLEEVVQNQLAPILTGPVLPGTVQLTPSGRLIVLMRDCQTTGGYPRVLQVSEQGMNVLAQKVMGDKISFRLSG